MPDPDTPKTEALPDVVTRLAQGLAKLPPGPLAELRRAGPGGGTAAFWRIYFAHGLDEQPGTTAEDWEWVVAALALLTPTGNDPEKRSRHDGGTPLGTILFDNRVSELRVAKVLNSPMAQRRETLMRLVRGLARTDARFNLTDLASLFLFADAGRARLRRLAQSYYAAEAAAMKED